IESAAERERRARRRRTGGAAAGRSVIRELAEPIAAERPAEAEAMRAPRPAAAIAAFVLVPAIARADLYSYFNRDDFSSEALYATGQTTVGARALALGGAYAAIADDATALAYNAAGLAQLVRIELGVGFRHQNDRSTARMFGTGAAARDPASDLD